MSIPTCAARRETEVQLVGEGQAVVSEREILEMNARAVAIMRIYRDNPSGQRRDSQRLVAELREVARWFVAARLSDLDLKRSVFEPIRAEFLERYGAEAGQRINAEFAKILRRKLVALAKSASSQHSVDQVGVVGIPRPSGSMNPPAIETRHSG